MHPNASRYGNFYWTPRCSVWITSVVSITFFAGWLPFRLIEKAVCAIQYAAHLIYPLEANPLWSQEWIGWGHPLGHKDGWSLIIALSSPNVNT